MPLAPLAADVTVDSTTWAALALVLTILGAAYSLFAFRRRGLASGLRGLAWTLVPVALWLTGTLKLAANIVNDVVDWAAKLVFSPTVWAGIIVAGVRSRSGSSPVPCSRAASGCAGRPSRDRAPGRSRPAGASRLLRPSDPAKKDDPDDMDEIEAILKRHGI